MISTNDFVPAGASFHESAGDGFGFPASHVNFVWMLLSFVKAALVMVNAPATSSVPSMSSPCARLSATAMSVGRGNAVRQGRRKKVYTGPRSVYPHPHREATWKLIAE